MGEIEIRVVAQTRFEGFHSWPDAPEEVEFLRNRHRHEFHVRAEKIVSHDNREVEFILLKQEIDATIEEGQEICAAEHWSCEQWAKHLLDTLKLDKVEVFEDGENGAVVTRKA